VRHFGINERDLVTIKPVSFVTSIVPTPERGNGVDAITGSSDSTSGVEDHEGGVNATVVNVVGGSVVVVASVVVGDTAVVVEAIVVVGASVVVGDTAVVVEAIVVVGASVVVGDTAVVVEAIVVVGASVVVGVGIQEIAMVPS